MTDDSGDDWIAAAVEEHSSALIAYAMQFTGDRDRARDVVQHAFVKLCSQRREDVEATAKAWLYTVCRNRALDVLRKENRMIALTEMDEPAVEADTALERHEAKETLLRALETLPHNQREAIRLKFLDGLSYREISRITKLSESNVGFLIHTGIGKLRTKLTPARERSIL